MTDQDSGILQNFNNTSNNLFEEVNKLEEKVQIAIIPPELKEKVFSMLQRLTRMAKFGGYSAEYEQLARYIEWIINLPWLKKSEDILDLNNAKTILDKNHFGLNSVKDRILEYLAVLELIGKNQKVSRAPILALVGLVGTGKTSLAYSVAEAMGRKFARIPFGGMGDSLELRGRSRVQPDAEPGLVIKTIRQCGTKNPVILLDEIDRVAEGARSDIMGVLIELLDIEQNMAFTDHYIDYPIDLSEVLFIATANNTTNISTAVLDRLEIIQMPSYSDSEKIIIAKNYILPRALTDNGLNKNSIIISEDVWPKIVRPLGFDAGLRTLERTIYGVCRKVAKFVVEGKGQTFTITNENSKEFLPNW